MKQGYILLLRGINVGGKNMISMPRLKSVLEGGGYEEVMTYINSGNVLFKSGEEDIIRLQADIHALLLRELGLDLSVMIISAGDLIEVSKNLPDWWGRGEGQKHNALFVIPPATAQEVYNEVGEGRPEYENVSYYGNVIFWTASLEKYSRTRWSRIVGTAAYDKVTIRNYNTFMKLRELAENYQ